MPSADTPAPAAADEPPLTSAGVADDFLTEFASGRATAAGALTDDPEAAATQLAHVWRTLAPDSVEAELTAAVDQAGIARFTLTWHLGPGRDWTYENVLHLVAHGDTWRVRWAPAVVHPRLPAGHGLVVHDRTGAPSVRDRTGKPLLTWTDDGPAAVRPAVAPLLLPGMGRVANGRGGGQAWYVAVVNQRGDEVAVVHGRRTRALTATLSRRVQRAAQAAVDARSLPAMLVAIQPSTGDVLAVAQNGAAGDAPVALNGLYPPGSTFKVATAAAILESGAAGPDTVLPCPGEVTVGQRTVHNADFALGDVPLRTAFAHSCNTTFAALAADLPPSSLAGAADRLGLGADFGIPGITTEAGSVRPAAGGAERVENSIGQGTVRVSCFGLAVLTATVASGQAVTPRLWRELDTSVNAGYQAPSPDVVAALRAMMREVVSAGTGSALAGYGEVAGKTGTAQVGDGSRAHGWFVGYRGDLAFATLVLDASTSAPALEVTGAFLAATG
ncbi:penicillin-binding protein [Actinophytocola sp. S1-96]|uniref:Penicillin-binding protein n=2 Tax=Actinophytocola gossypii TaxID=2812003 RepID=A0ABT2J230_9PSEU|nr:penicillin-binding protein [Actinophytocola gossypii]